MHKLQGRREELEFVSDAAQSIQAERAGSKNFRRPLPLLLDVVFRVFIGILNPVVAAVVVSCLSWILGFVVKFMSCGAPSPS